MAEALPLAVAPGFEAVGGGAVGEVSADFLPVFTRRRIAIEAEKLEAIELRAYKLGKKRWLYNECRLSLISQSGFFPEVEILESSRQGEDAIPAPINECGVKYLLKLRKGLRLEVEVYVAFDAPVPLDGPGTLLPGATPGEFEPLGFKWPPVLRKHCQKKCTGAILRSIQRYGRISRRTNKKAVEAEVEDRAKDQRYLYLSIDEASTHVGSRKFRLIAAVYEAPEEEGGSEADAAPPPPPAARKLLGSCCSLPITVLANNDAPNGPATIDLEVALDDGWAGWAALGAGPDDLHAGRNHSGESLQRERYPLDSPEGPSSVLSATANRIMLPGMANGRSNSGSRAQMDLALIRERAMMTADEEEGLGYESAEPGAKRPRTLLEPEFPPTLYARMETAPAALLSAGLSSSMASTFYTAADRAGADASTAGIGSLDSVHPQMQELEAHAMRHNSVSDSTALRSVLRHSSLPGAMPDLSVLQHGLHPMAVPGLRPHSLAATRPYRYNSMPFQGALLSELQAQTPHSLGLETRESLMWAGLQNPLQRLPAQGSAIRQESSPGNLMPPPREADAFPWAGASRGRERVQQAQNPAGTAACGANPFAMHLLGGVVNQEDQFWGHQVRQQRQQQQQQPQQQSPGQKDVVASEAGG